jgi:hypothetical protein
MRKLTLAAALGSMALLSACGTSTEDRTLGGAALGAGMGAGLGIAVSGIGALPGAAVGAITGATMGAFTEPERVNYGRPLWRQPDITEPIAEAIEGAEPTPQENPQRLTQ